MNNKIIYTLVIIVLVLFIVITTVYFDDAKGECEPWYEVNVTMKDGKPYELRTKGNLCGAINGSYFSGEKGIDSIRIELIYENDSEITALTGDSK